MDQRIVPAYADAGVRVWAIATEPPEMLEEFRDAYGLSLPILHDPRGQVFAQYQQEMPFATGAFPQEIIVGPDGTIVYAHNRFEVEAVRAALDAALAE
ncbi:MAG: redoxin domain-containing protein [Alphaproteobacteria bacterium]|nr:redoxin domain-containing protein [Alphaproteobacteria bacterium]